MMYAVFNSLGLATAFYDPQINTDIPPAAVPISRQQWQELVDRSGSIKWEDGQLVHYAPPPPTPEERLAVLPPVSHAQIIAALVLSEVISEAEGVAWLAGTLPAAVETAISQLPSEQQRIVARLRAIRPSSVVPTDPLVSALASAEGKTIEDLVDIFSLAASL